ncbi:DUF924 domain-containing protein [Ferrovibrio terrae]|uniref:DUF924 domain-containing protein n=1 Tax=Ferrovibrio terrae TaxID=2594003 RepID=A0A516GYC6_9PROT|nr:DUF924 family protein [Ferrovibrio terrae]QDO96526.1 DUF924 domain-containing protein [Ferrovibrio terrae]
MTTPDDILDFWFDRQPDVTSDAAVDAPLKHRKAWFEKNDAFDAQIRSRFSAAVETALAGGYADWAETAEGALALLILLDQFSRNLFRGQAKAFAGDARARIVARQAVDRGFDIALQPVMRMFFYLPFEHSEHLPDQELAHLLFSALDKDLPGHDLAGWADKHRVIIARFGRFPHRNAALGRDSSPEEVEFLKQPGSSF